jgi:hypothetical protein
MEYIQSFSSLYDSSYEAEHGVERSGFLMVIVELIELNNRMSSEDT